MAADSPFLYEFGEFRVDPEKQLLLRAGSPVAVTPKVFETLLILLRNNGEIVTKDELMRQLWPDSFVEESNLSQNIFMLRKALGDTAEDRRHIITVPGRGYRFAGGVRVIPQISKNIVLASRTRSQLVVEQTEVEEETSAALPAPSTRHRPWYGYAISATLAIAVLLTSVFLLVRRHPSPVLNASASVLIGDFTNSTGDPVFDDALRQGLAVQLEQSPVLSLVSESRIQHTLQLMDRPPGTRLTHDLAREACTRAGAAALLDGSIAKLGSQYVIGLRAVDCRSGATLDQEQAQVATKEDVLNGLSQIASRFRTRIGESLAAVQEHDTPLADATTPSLEALQAYSMGHKLISSAGAERAIPFFQRAIAIDPHFAMAHALLGRAYADLGEAALSAQSTATAYQMRDRTSDAEKFWITAAYDMQVTENMEEARRTCEVWERTYPRDPTPSSFLAGIIHPVLGEYQRAVDEAQKALKTDPDFLIAYGILSASYEALGSLDDAERTFRDAEMRNIDIPELTLSRYDVAFVRGDQNKMDQLAAAAHGNQPLDEWITQHSSSAFAYQGQVKRARAAAEKAEQLAKQAGHPESVALYKSGEAIWEAFLGDDREAREKADAALKLSNDRGVEFGAGFALALSGDTARAEELANDIDKRFPEDTSVQCIYLPALRGQIAIDRRDPRKALQFLERSAPCELGMPRTAIHANFGALYPLYVKGQALLALRNGAEAAREFEKITTHPGVVLSDPVGAIANLQLARALAMAGEKDKAESAYKHVLDLWKSADPGVLPVTQARAEYLHLSSAAK